MAKAVTVTWKLQEMAISDFMGKLLGQGMGVAGTLTGGFMNMLSPKTPTVPKV